MSDMPVTLPDLLAKVRHIGEEVIRPAAAAVDSEARFPHEAIEALREERLLAAYIPREYGGLAYTVSELAAIAQTLAQYCSSTAMIWAMHQIQIACIVQHEQGSSSEERQRVTAECPLAAGIIPPRQHFRKER